MDIISFIEEMVGTIPPELESFVYVLAVLVLIYVIKCFFELLTSVFGVTKWTRSD